MRPAWGREEGAAWHPPPKLGRARAVRAAYQSPSRKKAAPETMDLDAIIDYLQGHATARHVHVDQLDEAAPAARLRPLARPDVRQLTKNAAASPERAKENRSGRVRVAAGTFIS